MNIEEDVEMVLVSFPNSGEYCIMEYSEAIKKDNSLYVYKQFKKKNIKKFKTIQDAVNYSYELFYISETDEGNPCIRFCMDKEIAYIFKHNDNVNKILHKYGFIFIIEDDIFKTKLGDLESEIIILKSMLDLKKCKN